MGAEGRTAHRAGPRAIVDLGASLGIRPEELEPYGNGRAKVSLALAGRLEGRPVGRLVVVSCLTPTRAGEGKTTTAIGLTQALGRLGTRVALCLREPSLGPIFGTKGGAIGSGAAQLVPGMEINLHFTGDFHAVTAAHNLLAALVDNHLGWGNELRLDPHKVTWLGALDVCNRQLRHVVVGMGEAAHCVPRQTGFEITASSEVMAILSLATGIRELKDRLGRIVVGTTYGGALVTAAQLQAVGPMAVLLKDAIRPNLVQTMEGQPAFVHTGPFANTAHGNSSVLATRLALRLADVVVTESGFGADLGVEKLCDLVCRTTDLRPDLVVLVVTAKALRAHGAAGGGSAGRVLEGGFANLDQHLENVAKFGLPVVVAINRFPEDSEEDLATIRAHCRERHVPVGVSDGVRLGGEGVAEVADHVLQTLEQHPARFTPLYPLEAPVSEKLATIARELYRADGVDLADAAREQIAQLTAQGFGGLPVNIVRTPFSFTHDAGVLGAPRGWALRIVQVHVAAGAGFLVALTGRLLLMPGLPRHPAAETMDLLDDGTVVGKF